jgi:carboxypeptidase T
MRRVAGSAASPVGVASPVGASSAGSRSSGVAPALPAANANFPPRDSRYHNYPEMVAHIHAVAAAHPGIVQVLGIGKSFQGRTIWAAKVSDHVAVDEAEPEVLFDGLHHAREHLSAEMTIHILDLLATNYGRATTLGRRVTRLVNSREVWIIFMVNPDGGQYDLTGNPYRAWRKNRQPTPGTSRVGTDINRNYGYKWGCCGGSSGSPAALDYRGPKPWSTPEARVVRDFVLSRIVNGRQQIRAHITFHTAGEQVLWPYGHTAQAVPPDMTRLDHRALAAMGRAMAATNGYRPMQSVGLYPTDGDQIDWMYGSQRIFSYTFEMFPRNGPAPARYYPADELIGRETSRNDRAVLYMISNAKCPYAVLGASARAAFCGPLYDDFETSRGWTVDPHGTDTATGGAWARGVPAAGSLQLGDAISGRAVLVTGRAAEHDVDGGTTTVESPVLRLPAGRSNVRLRYWVGLGATATSVDGFSVRLVAADGAVLATALSVLGNGLRQPPTWQTLDFAIPASLAGRSVAVRIEARDTGAASTVEAGVDDVRITAP